MRADRLWPSLLLLFTLGLACEPEGAPGEPEVPLASGGRALATVASATPGSVTASSIAEPEQPSRLLLPWGAGPGQVGLHPGGVDTPPAGPAALTVTPEGGLWILDPRNGRVVHLGPAGAWQGAVACPPAVVDLAAGSGGRLFLLSLANLRVTVLAQAGALEEEVPLPRALRHLAGLAVEDGDRLLLRNAYQETFELGRPGAWHRWPDLLHTRVEGWSGAADDSRLQVLMRGETGLLLRRPAGARQGTPMEELRLTGTEGAASVVLLGVWSDGRFALLEERFTDHVGQVARRLLWYSRQGRLLGDEPLPARGLYLPEHEFAAAPDGRLLQLQPRAEGLVVQIHRGPAGGQP